MTAPVTPFSIWIPKGVNSQTPPWDDGPTSYIYIHGKAALNLKAVNLRMEGGYFSSFGPGLDANGEAQGLFCGIIAGVPMGFVRFHITDDDGNVLQTVRAYYDGVRSPHSVVAMAMAAESPSTDGGFVVVGRAPTLGTGSKYLPR